MKILNFIIAAISFLFAAFQWNDPDPLLWIVLYGCVGVIALLAGLGKHWMPVTLLLAFVCVYLMGSRHEGVTEFLFNDDGQTMGNAMSKDFAYIEEWREYGGALIALLFLGAIAWTAGCCRIKPLTQIKSKPIPEK